MEKIRLLLIEDNELLRARLSGLFQKSAEFELLAALAEGTEALTRARLLKPGIVLLDMSLGEENSLELARALGGEVPEARLVVLGFLPTQGDVLEFLEAGASGFVLKDAPSDEVLRSIKLVARGKTVFPLSLADSLFSRIVKEAAGPGKKKIRQGVRLTGRERTALELAAKGLADGKIARRLGISVGAVRKAFDRIFKKLAGRARREDLARSGKRTRPRKTT